MSVTYKEITDSLYIPECIAMQKKVFGLSDVDIFPESYFSLLMRKQHPLGLVVGCFLDEDNKSELIGLTVLQNDRLPNSLYCLFIGILPEYQNKMYGYHLAKKVKDIAVSKGYVIMYGIYDPLEANLGKLYAYLGVTADTYINEPYKLNTDEVIVVDKVLFTWSLDDTKAVSNSAYLPKKTYKEAVNQYPIVGSLGIDAQTILIEIPGDYLDIKKTNHTLARKWRDNTRILFDNYINKNNYTIIDCLSGKTESERKTYYLLHKFKL
jgi:predicted GNAT superfamily acetyltransferase